ncbi:hypothetical protein KR067_002991 [Drosophila pandora]|nr:hypothetical protein KR067_002991 [Drosophila pandora]
MHSVYQLLLQLLDGHGCYTLHPQNLRSWLFLRAMLLTCDPPTSIQCSNFWVNCSTGPGATLLTRKFGILGVPVGYVEYGETRTGQEILVSTSMISLPIATMYFNPGSCCEPPSTPPLGVLILKPEGSMQ